MFAASVIFVPLISLITVAIIHILLTLIKQYRVNKFFQLKSPNLPVAEGASILGGHASSLIHQKYNIFKIDELHKRYGRTFGFYYGDQPAVATTDLDLLKTMIIDEGHVNHHKRHFAVSEFEDDGIFAANGTKWERLRRATAPALTNHKIKSENVNQEIKEIIEKLIDSLHARIRVAKTDRGENYTIQDASDIFWRYSIALVFKCFYRQDNIVDFNAEQERLVKLMIDSAESAKPIFYILSMAFPISKRLFEWLSMTFTPLGEIHDNIMSFIEQQTTYNLETRRKQTPESGTKFNSSDKNLVDYFIDQYHSGKVSRLEYFYTSYFMFFAANKTTSDAITMLIYHLAKHQDIQQRLRNSLKENGLGSEYLQWCINEAIRLFPPVPLGGARIISRDFLTKEGYLIPANTWIYASDYTIHRAVEYWGPDANEFKPERWAQAKEFHPMQYLGFGAGKRDCLGKHFASQAMKLLMKSLMGQFKFEWSKETKEIKKFQSPYFLFLKFDDPIQIKISEL